MILCLPWTLYAELAVAVSEAQTVPQFSDTEEAERRRV